MIVAGGSGSALSVTAAQAGAAALCAGALVMGLLFGAWALWRRYGERRGQETP